MSNDPAWSYDYCIICGKQTFEGLYCSNSCRLQDGETIESTSTPINTSKQKTSGSSSQSVSPFNLPPAVNFPPRRSTSAASPTSTKRKTGVGVPPSPPLHKTGPEPVPPLKGNPSSSVVVVSPSSFEALRLDIPVRHDKLRTASDSSSKLASGGVSPEAKIELQRYEACFDRTRRQSRAGLPH